MPTLTIQLPGRPPVEHLLREVATTLGRATGNTIALADSSVSQEHAEIIRHGNDYLLRDLKSTNSTLLNGQSISEARLYDRDVLKLGEVIAIFELRSSVGLVSTPAIPAASLPPVPVSKSEKSDTTVLSTKAKTTLLKPVSPRVDVIPATPPPERKSPLTLVASILGAVLVAGVVIFLVWKPAGGGPAKVTVATHPNPPPQPAPAEHVPSTNIDAEPVKPTLTSEPAMVAGTPPPIADATNAIVQPETNNLPELLAALRSRDVSERRHAAREISALESGAGSAVLNLRLAVLQDADLEVRAWLVIALVKNQSYDQAAVPVLVEALSHEGAVLRQRACATLALIPYDESSKVTAVAALKSAADDESEDVRKEARATLKLIAPVETK